MNKREIVDQIIKLAKLKEERKYYLLSHCRKEILLKFLEKYKNAKEKSYGKIK